MCQNNTRRECRCEASLAVSGELLKLAGSCTGIRCTALSVCVGLEFSITENLKRNNRSFASGKIELKYFVQFFPLSTSKISEHFIQKKLKKTQKENKAKQLGAWASKD